MLAALRVEAACVYVLNLAGDSIAGKACDSIWPCADCHHRERAQSLQPTALALPLAWPARLSSIPWPGQPTDLAL